MIQRRSLAALAAPLFLPTIARAQDGPWPNRPVTLLVPWAPGGSNDVVARLMAPGLAETFGRPFVVENRPGGGGSLGMTQVVRARPDGHTLLISSASNHVINPFVIPDQGYDVRDALAPISMLVDVPNALVVHPSLNVTDVQGLIALIKATPGGMAFGSSGVGSTNHLAGELFRLRTGVELTHIPYRGGGPALADMLSGTIKLSFQNLPTVLPAHLEGRLRIIAVCGDTRVSIRPELPTVQEQGVPDYAVRSWTGLFAPAGTSAEIRDRIADTTKRLLVDASLKTRLDALASEALWLNPSDTDAFVRREYDRWGPVLRQAGVTAG
ncbi:Bug family tripartite tricarboxylate transporter substrate binding protein [Humitalea sp. 24SJ18S-53]|uniref:Bug family tripartite tricarboxylate transporter substrate binding protein n=1 Tax=Humitalea sp. 24SJ18S-53 TaxID=3422307 RepID=UPI003D676FB8